MVVGTAAEARSGIEIERGKTYQAYMQYLHALAAIAGSSQMAFRSLLRPAFIEMPASLHLSFVYARRPAKLDLWTVRRF